MAKASGTTRKKTLPHKGAKMINVNNAFKSVLNKKNVHSAEKEYLLHRNTRLKVINTTTKNGTKYIRAKLLNK